MEPDYLEELLDSGFYDGSVEEIALEFQIPPPTAASWERNIGDLDTIKETLGEYGPEDYLHFIRRREWIQHERDDIEDEWLSPLSDWFMEESDSISLIKEAHQNPEFREWRDQKRKMVRYELTRLDDDWIGLTIELRRIDNTLAEIYNKHLESLAADLNYKKNEIKFLKTRFPYLRDNNRLLAHSIDCSYSYAAEFKHIPGEGVSNRRVKGSLRDDVLERDGHECVSCGAQHALEVHHIIPRDSGGENSKENLAVLCEDCHYYAHGGGKKADGRYFAASYNSVEYSSQEEFWNEWIDGDYEERPSKGFAGVDFS